MLHSGHHPCLTGLTSFCFLCPWSWDFDYKILQPLQDNWTKIDLLLSVFLLGNNFNSLFMLTCKAVKKIILKKIILPSTLKAFVTTWHISWNSTRTTSRLQLQISYKTAISFTLNKEEFPPLLSVYSLVGSFTDTAKSNEKVKINLFSPLVNQIFIIYFKSKIKY